MSGSNEQAVASGSELDDELVRDYLKENGDFLQRNPDLLDHLHISHASGSAVSLVEKQVSVLRERNVEMRHRLNALTAHARENDQLFDNTRKLVLQLLEARSRKELYRAFMHSLKHDFKVEHASLILFGEPGSEQGCRLETADSARIELGAILKGRKPMCGVLRKEELGYLFPDAGEIGSAAVVPLIQGEELGIAAVGSSDANRYHSGMGTLFLTHIADVIVRCLARLPHDDAG
jgi:uncharacterized protein YigA (DUF484 family)